MESTRKGKRRLPFMMTGKQKFSTEYIKQLIENKKMFY